MPWLERLNIRLEMTLVLSLALHAVLLSAFLQHRFAAPEKRLELTEVEFQAEEAPKPTEIEKLMNHLTAPAPPPAKAVRTAARAAAAEAELARSSFQSVVGLHGRALPRADVVTAADLKRLAALPKLELTRPEAVPKIQPPVKRLALAHSSTAARDELENKVVPLAELPAADFGPGISKRGFQQPELIIKQVKAERRAQAPAANAGQRLSLSRDAYISGEVKDRDVLHREYPPVPRWLEEKGVEAEVVIRFVVNPDGEVGDKLYVQKTSGYAELDRLAIEALKKFVFAPLPLTVRQLEQNGTIIIRFTLHH